MKWARNLVNQGKELLERKKTQPPVRLFGYLLPEEPLQIRDFSSISSLPAINTFLREIPAASRELVEIVLQSREIHKILTVAADFSPDDNYDQQEFSGSLAGVIYEHLAFQYLKLKYEDTAKVLLTPEETFILYRNLYGERRVVNNYSLNLGISRTAFPDGLIIIEDDEFLRIDAAVEYKSAASDKSLDSRSRQQLSRFKNGQLVEDLRIEGLRPIDPLYHGTLIHLLRPSLPAKPLTVNPDSAVILALPENSSINIDGVKIEPVPIHTKNLNTLVDVLKIAYILDFSSIND